MSPSHEATPYVCPKCIGPLQQTPNTFNCAQCKLHYPAPDGVPYFVFYGSDWYLKLREVMLYRDFCAKLKSGVVERDRIAAHQQMGALTFSNLTTYFEQACDRINFASAPRILDVGAGCGEVSQKLAERGAQVDAVDLNLFDLHYDVRWMAFADMSGKDFYQILRGAPITTPAFRRAIADADYLPFANGTFDYIVMRAVAHHLFDLPRFMREANRVLKPGGQLLLIAEPLASVLDDPAEYSRGDLDFEEGMHETRPYYYKYSQALQQAGFASPEIQGYHIGFGFRGDRMLCRLRSSFALNTWLTKHLVRGIATRLLNITAGCMNLYTQKRHELATRRAENPNEPLPQVALADLLAASPNNPAPAHDVLRKHLPRTVDSIDLTQTPVDRLLVRGVRAPELIAGTPGAYLLTTFTTYLGRDAASPANALTVHYNADRLEGAEPIVHLNSQPLAVTFQPGGWKTLTIPLPTNETIYELRIEQPHLTTQPRPLQQPRDIGLAISKLWLDS